VTQKLTEVRRLLDRYIVEIVEVYGFCPWAKPARLGGEIAVEVLWGTPADAAWFAAARALLARPETRVAMIVAPELAVTPAELRAIRDRVSSALGAVGVAEFHPDAALDLASPGRLVPYLRRSPDPMLQLVPLALLDSVREHTAVIDLNEQALMLGGLVGPTRGDVADELAAKSHATVSARVAEVAAVLDDIAADRRRSYARAGITARTSR
jgi:hypothetical protein